MSFIAKTQASYRITAEQETFENELDAVMAARKLAKKNEDFYYAIEWKKMGYWTVSNRKPSMRDGKVVEVQPDGSEHHA